MKILVVDDNEVSRKVLRLALRNLGYEHVEMAEDGFAALQIAAQISFDLIFMDLQMPRMSGFETVEKIRELPCYTANQPIFVAVTAYASDEKKTEAHRSKMQGFLSKPVDQEILKALVERILEQKKSEEPEP